MVWNATRSINDSVHMLTKAAENAVRFCLINSATLQRQWIGNSQIDN